ncbi:hypothetical protein LTS18_006216 [Coniosporium uncinatum]|uniref:Uncharacterized protein n=1 Tax=Coniosporium uncinatum TaxID=93489 RepID=A0ACC3DD96_9PEZI|nr:hypothetical protein LTS18_006216 [Coniosporium uncinatum]
MSDCCKTGFNWNGKPTGSESTFANTKTYVAGSNKDRTVLMVHDVFGWTFPNLRLLADHYAKEANATVYLPDFFDGEVIDPSTLEDPEKRKNFDLMAFIGRHSKEIRYPEIESFAKELRSKYKKVGAIGFCYGGWAVFKLAAKGNDLLDCVSTAHPSLLEKSEVSNLGVPTQLLIPETDQMFTPELKEFSLKTLPEIGVEFDYQYFPGLVHGFAAKGDENDKKQKDGLERAKNAAVGWFVQYLD